ILSIAYLINGRDVIGNNEVPVAETLSQNLCARPAKQSLGRRRPPQYTELVIPLDHSERSILNVKGEAMSFLGSGFRTFAISYITNDCDSADNLSVFVVTGRIVTVEESGAPCLGNVVRSPFSDNGFSFDCFLIKLVLAGFFQVREEFKSVFA